MYEKREYKVVLKFTNINKEIDGIGRLTKKECEKRIADFLMYNPNFEEENNIKFCVVRVDK